MTRLHILLAAALGVSALLSNAPVEAKSKQCPPGLAKKAVPCVPPGQVGKSWQYDDDDDHARYWHRGDRVRDDYVLIPRSQWDRWNLRDYDDGSTYLRTDNQILRVMRDTLTVIEAVEIVGELFD